MLIPRSYVPDLGQVRNTNSAEMRFYAAIGILTSLSAALERAYLDVFMRGTRLNEIAAAAILLNVRNSSTQRDMALMSLSIALQGQAEELAWQKMCNRIRKVTGASGLRNLAAHAVVSKSVVVFPGTGHYVREHDGTIKEVFGPSLPNREPEEDYRVIHEGNGVLARANKNFEAAFEAIFASAKKVGAILVELEELISRIS